MPVASAEPKIDTYRIPPPNVVSAGATITQFGSSTPGTITTTGRGQASPFVAADSGAGVQWHTAPVTAKVVTAQVGDGSYPLQAQGRSLVRSVGSNPNLLALAVGQPFVTAPSGVTGRRSSLTSTHESPAHAKLEEGRIWRAASVPLSHTVSSRQPSAGHLSSHEVRITAPPRHSSRDGVSLTGLAGLRPAASTGESTMGIYFESVEGLGHVDPQGRGFPHSLGPFALKTLKGISSADLRIEAAPSGGMTWTADRSQVQSPSLQRLLEALPDVALRGSLSPLRPCTLSEIEIVTAGLPQGVAHVAWSYPVGVDWGSVPSEALLASDPDSMFLRVGGYVYFDEDLNVLHINALEPSPEGTERFGPPKPWQPEWTLLLQRAGRFHPITLHEPGGGAMASFCDFCWLAPGEIGGICPLGGFAYLFPYERGEGLSHAAAGGATGAAISEGPTALQNQNELLRSRIAELERAQVCSPLQSGAGAVAAGAELAAANEELVSARTQNARLAAMVRQLEEHSMNMQQTALGMERGTQDNVRVAALQQREQAAEDKEAELVAGEAELHMRMAELPRKEVELQRTLDEMSQQAAHEPTGGSEDMQVLAVENQRLRQQLGMLQVLQDRVKTLSQEIVKVNSENDELLTRIQRAEAAGGVRAAAPGGLQEVGPTVGDQPGEEGAEDAEHNASSHERPRYHCVPTLYSRPTSNDDLNSPKYDGVCALVLIALGDAEWHRGPVQWRLDDPAKADLLREIQRRTPEAFRDERLTREGLSEFVELNNEKIRRLPHATHGLLNEDLVEHAFAYFDNDKNGLDFREWDAFLDELEMLHLRFELRIAFQGFRAFFGRGQPWFDQQSHDELSHLTPELLRSAAGSTAVTRKWPCDQFQCGYDQDMTLGSWLHDLHYYSANNHPVHAILCCDQSNDTNYVERLVIELATCELVFLSQGLRYAWVEHDKAPVGILHIPIVFGALNSILGIVVWWVLYLLFTCPKIGLADKSRDSTEKVQQAERLSRLGECAGYALWVLATIAIVLEDHHQPGFRIWCTLHSRVVGYFFSWGMMVFVYFNPFVAWGQPDPEPEPGMWANFAFLGDCIGLGQWRIERQLFQGKCTIVARRLSVGDTTGDLFSETSHSALLSSASA